MFKLYSGARSSASFRMRIALNLKGLPFEYVAVDLRKGDQFKETFRKLNPQELVPLLDDGTAHLTQSLATIEYLEEKYPQPPLLPHAPVDRAYVRSVALAIACEIHPLNNLRVLRYLTDSLKVSEDDKSRWYRHWVETGLEAVERQLAAQPTRFCHGEAPGMADCVLVPQIFNARRFDCRTDHVPNVMRVFDTCMQLDAFSSTRPEACPDAAA
jgi:maleylacetoacetate isomerase/maleylpyruvate isomerase